jgi:Zn finger protein HypA/HybF involved in hydrogenase expression
VNPAWCEITSSMSETDTQPPGVCPTCDSTLAYPVDWQQLAGALWLAWLRCPNCESIIPRVLDDDAVYELDEMLDRGTDALVGDLKRIARGESTDWLVPGRPYS